MATKSYIELPRITEPTNLDVLAIVDSGYTTTYQITRQNLLNSSSPLSYVKNKQNILSKWCDDTSMSSGQWFSTIIGGSEHRIEGDNFYNTILGGKRNRMTGGSLGFRTIVGGYDNRILNANGYNGIFAGYNNEINGGDYGTTILGGYFNTITNGTYGATMVGVFYSTMNQVGSSVMAGGVGNSMTATNDSFMGGGRSNTLNNGYANGGSTIIAGESNSLTGNLNAIIGGNNNTITGGTHQVMLGCSGRTALYDYTTYVENSHNFKTESFGVINAGSVGGSIDVDCSLGTLFYFTITANTTPNFINWKEGQRVQFWIDNSGSFTVPTATITGGGSVYAKSGTLNPTNNEITSYYGTIVNGNMFLDEHLNFQPV
jgi:hypothetical protein